MFSITRLRAQRTGGQSLVEFAIVLPIILFLTMIALDFGRIYLGYVNVQNMARIGANFAADHPKAWTDNDLPVQTAYQNEIINDAKAINCDLPGGVAPDPTFPSGTSVGATAIVAITCSFSVITPVVSGVLGDSVSLAASSVFPVKRGNLAVSGGGLPNASFGATPTSGNAPLDVTFTDTSSGSPTTWLWDFGDATGASTQTVPIHTYPPGTYIVCLSVANTVGPDPTPACQTITVGAAPVLCIVPDFTGTNTGPGGATAQAAWAAAGFTTTVDFKQGGLPWVILSQSVTGLSQVVCDSSIRVSKTSTP